MKAIVLFLFIFSYSCFGQQKMSDAEFEKARADYVKMSESETYKLKMQAAKEFARKLNHQSGGLVVDDQEWIRWISANLGSTQFKTVEEASAMRQDLFALSALQMAENAELYEILKRSSYDQFVKIIEPDVKYVRR